MMYTNVQTICDYVKVMKPRERYQVCWVKKRKYADDLVMKLIRMNKELSIGVVEMGGGVIIEIGCGKELHP